MGPKRVAFFSFFIILHFSLISGNYTQNIEYNFSYNLASSNSTNNDKYRNFSRPIEKTIAQIDEKYVLILSASANVLINPDPKSKVIGLAKKGDHYSLLKEDDVWCRIIFKKNQDGWIESRFVTIVDTPPPPPFIVFFAIIFSIITIILIWVLYFLINKKNMLKKEWFSTKQIQKKILIVSDKETHVKRHLTNTTLVMEHCFKETGFNVQTANSTLAAKKIIFQYRPDAIVVDWQLKDSIQMDMENILSSKSTTSNMFVLFYNISDLSGIQKSKIIQNTHYLPHTFTDRDLFNIINPVVITGEKKQAITKSVETSALQGNVADGGVEEVFQFIEIGKKNGCLLIEDIKPSGIVYFKDGIIIYAATENNRGQKAVFEILDFDRGRFIFVLDKKPKAHNCSIPTLGILMEWARINDENTGNRLRKT